jgi:hypothetical protein
MTKIEDLFETFENLNFEFVSDLGFRASDFRQLIHPYLLPHWELGVTYLWDNTLPVATSRRCGLYWVQART